MSKNRTNNKSTETNSTTPPAEKKTRVRRDHSNDFKLFVIKLVPGTSFIVVTNSNAILRLYAVTMGTERALRNKLEDKFAFNYVQSVVKQRNGPKADATMTLATNMKITAAENFANAYIHTVDSATLWDEVTTDTTPEVIQTALNIASEVSAK